MARTPIVLVLVVSVTVGLAGCFTPRVNVNVDKDAVGQVKEMVSRVAGDGGSNTGKSSRQ